VVELVVVGLGFLGAEAFQQRQRAKAVWFIEIAAMPIRVVFGDEFVALPEKLSGYIVDGFADAATERVVAVAGGLAVGFFNTDQTMLAVVAVFGDELMAFAASFADEVAECVVADLPEDLIAWIGAASRPNASKFDCRKWGGWFFRNLRYLPRQMPDTLAFLIFRSWRVVVVFQTCQ